MSRACLGCGHFAGLFLLRLESFSSEDSGECVTYGDRGRQSPNQCGYTYNLYICETFRIYYSIWGMLNWSALNH